MDKGDDWCDHPYEACSIFIERLIDDVWRRQNAEMAIVASRLIVSHCKTLPFPESEDEIQLQAAKRIVNAAASVLLAVLVDVGDSAPDRIKALDAIHRQTLRILTEFNSMQKEKDDALSQRSTAQGHAGGSPWS